MTSSLIIITLNRAALLQRTLEGLARQSRQIDEIIVIDNGPTRDTEQVVSASTARYVAGTAARIWARPQSRPGRSAWRRDLFLGRRLRSGARLVGRALERSRLRRCRSRQRLPRSRPAGSCGAPRISLHRRSRVIARSCGRSRAPSVHFEPDSAARGGRRKSAASTPRSPCARIATSPPARASSASACATNRRPA